MSGPLKRSVETKNDVSPGALEDGNSRLDDRDRLLSAARAESDQAPEITPEARSSITRPRVERPLVYCPTCRDEHAEDAPHFANRERENGV